MSEAEQQFTLLFVDDEPNILSSLRRLFKATGYGVLTAGGGAEGLEVLAREKVDLIVSDMRMPEMDGAQFLEQARARWPHVARILLTGYADIGSTIDAINRGEIYRYISKPWDDNEILLTVRGALEHQRLKSENERLLALTRRQNEELKDLNAGLERKVAERTAELQETLNSLDRAHKQLHQGFMSTVRIFAGLIEMRGGKLAGHSRRVAEHARQVAQALGLGEKEQQDMLLAGLLHDIGKISLPDDLLNRPFNGLPPDQQALVMQHPARGQQALIGVEQLANAAKIIRHHHECMDGSGYPDRLSGLAIPIGARILAVTNEYDALQMGTLTLQAMTSVKALEFIMTYRGRRYDPTVVDAFKTVLAGPAGGAEHAVRQGIGVGVMRDAPHEKPQRHWKEISLHPSKLKPGMTLSRKLMHEHGYLLLAAGQHLDELVIEQLQKMENETENPITVHIRVEDRS
ncbi:MAG: response regulator [Sulfurisoma sp.]|nr:response regulator [Sulfurisoma sp.]